MSHGPNLFGGYIYHASGQRFTLTGAGTREVENTDNNATLTYADFADAGPNQFDDSVGWMQPADTTALLQKSGTISDPAVMARAQAETLSAALIADAKRNGNSIRTPSAPNTAWSAIGHGVNFAAGGCAAPTPSAIQVGSFANAPLGLPASALISPWGGAIRYIRGDTLVGSSCQSQ
ncbi:hypothetical protein, partial [Parachitinimonas caeni]